MLGRGVDTGVKGWCHIYGVLVFYGRGVGGLRAECWLPVCRCLSFRLCEVLHVFKHFCGAAVRREWGQVCDF